MGSLMQSEPEMEKKPVGIRFLERIKGSKLSYNNYQAVVLIVTFLAYASYHAARKTTSIVKSALDPQSPDTGLNSLLLRFTSFGSSSSGKLEGGGWAPFNGPNGTVLLGEIDVAFLAVYAFGMYFAGHLGDRMNLRIFLTVGMVGTGLFTSLFGVGYWANIHSFYYFLIMQMLAGLFQSSGWPSVVAVVGNWFNKKKRGLIMGIWNAHTSVGNITGSLIAAAMLRYGWGWSFVVPGVVIVLIGLVNFAFLPVSPELVGAERDEDVVSSSEKIGNSVNEPLLLSSSDSETDDKKRAVGFIEAWKIPGVAPFALCLFFAKLVAYTFLYWLPFYVSHTAIEGEYLSDETAGNLSTMFDVGGVVGGIMAGYISDRIGARAITAASFMYCSIPALFFYRSYGHVSLLANASLMFLTGMLVNGPYALITTAVSADLGTHSSLKGNSRALATVTAIIDGTGSVGAAVGPLLTGYISSRSSWTAVFTMLMGAAFVAGLLLTRLVMAEVAEKIAESRPSEECRTPVDHEQGHVMEV
ncbi:PREDICTED: putative glycerol-3-phosphate transporter 1 [Camelina sativa]|uniref:Glycerol-3-phosphate transporter 1 n=1 Tax=Camelina sativa TaxID=90675 RepID=A0ABM0TGQ7_CAMSA|nr:PREDICTED: putative glycerol-3-phosphate transporter 1 [Camelina sativa]